MCNDSPSRRSGRTSMGIFLALGLVLSSLILAGVLEKIKIGRKTINVKGYAERLIVSDTAIWHGTLTARDADLAVSSAKLQKNLAALLSYLDQNGVPGDVPALSPLQTRIVYERNKDGVTLNDIDSYVLSQTIKITSTNVHLIARIATESSSALIKQSIEFASEAPAYMISSSYTDQLKMDLLGEATRNARARAELLAVNSGGRIAGLQDASQGVFQIRAPHSTDISGSGEYDTGTIDKKISAVVSLEFAFEQ